MDDLKGSDRRYLRGLANNLEPIVYVGKNGLTEALVAAVDDALNSHELIKMKFNDFKGEKREIAASVVEQTQSHLIAIIGNIATLYRQQEDKEKRKITLPG